MNEDRNSEHNLRSRIKIIKKYPEKIFRMVDQLVKDGDTSWKESGCDFPIIQEGNGRAKIGYTIHCRDADLAIYVCVARITGINLNKETTKYDPKYNYRVYTTTYTAVFNLEDFYAFYFKINVGLDSLIELSEDIHREHENKLEQLRLLSPNYY